MLTRFRGRFVPFLATLSLAPLVACDDVTDPPVPLEGSFTVDASTNWTFVSLTDSAIVALTPAQAKTSSAWDIGFFSTNVVLNGGEAGPGGVTGSCICQNSAATDAQILAMTPDSELADFEAVTGTPATATFTGEVLSPAITAWYTGSGAAAVANPGRTFLVRLADGTSYAKVHVTSITGATATTAGSVTLEYAVQASSTAALGPTETITLTAGGNGADLKTDALSATTWDIRLDGWNLLTNGGFSGSGNAGVFAMTAPFASITSAFTMAPYSTDGFAGVFAAYPYYKYNILGDNRISPRFEVYLIKRGTSVYRLQVLNYYSSTGAGRHITFRYKQIS